MRIYKFDNVKALLIFLVVVGHMANYYVDISNDMKILFFFIYLFHMPLFIFISGLFIKSTVNGKRFKVERVISYFLLYLIMKILTYLLLKYGLNNSELKFNTFNESESPWYLLAMAIWICLTYILKNVKPKIMLSISIIAALLIGYDSFAIDYFIVSRVIVFYPFFLLGYYTDVEKVLEICKNKYIKIFSIFVILLSIIIIYFNIDYIYQFRGFITGRNPYVNMNQTVLGAFYRLALLLWTSFLSFAILNLIPNKKFIFTGIGERTLQIYFLHMFCIYSMKYYQIDEFLMIFSTVHWLKIYIALSIPLTLLLAIKPLELPFIKMMSFKYRFLFQKSK